MAGIVERLIRDIPDFPEPGDRLQGHHAAAGRPRRVRHRDRRDGRSPWVESQVDLVVGIEARGFLFGATDSARQLGVGFVPVRKPGEAAVHHFASIDYGLEYGTDTLEIHTDAVATGQRVVVIDDVLATGGTAAASAELIARPRRTTRWASASSSNSGFFRGRERARRCAGRVATSWSGRRLMPTVTRVLPWRRGPNRSTLGRRSRAFSRAYEQHHPKGDTDGDRARLRAGRECS